MHVIRTDGDTGEARWSSDEAGGAGAVDGRNDDPSSSSAIGPDGESGFARSARLQRDLAWEALAAEADRLGPDDRFRGTADDDLADQVSTGAAQLDAALCAWLEQLAELVVRRIWAHQGARTPGAWLSWKVGIAGSTAREHVRVALRLREFPAIRDRFAAGTLSYSKVRSLTRCGDPSFEPLLLSWADHATAAQLETIVAGFRRAQRAAHDHDPDLDGHDPAYTWRARSNGDGTRTLTIRGPADQLAELEDATDRLAHHLATDRTTADTHGTDADGDGAIDATGATGATGADLLGVAVDDEGRTDDLPDPTPTRRHPTATDRLDALTLTVLAAAAADTPPDTSGLDRHTLVLDAYVHDLGCPRPVTDEITGGPQTPREDHLPTAEDTAGTDAHPADGADGHERPPPLDLVRASDTHRRVLGLDRSTLRRIACDAGIVLALNRPDHVVPDDELASDPDEADGADDDAGPGTVDLGRRRRLTDTRLRRTVHRRDRGTCTFPGCHTTRNLHVHHAWHWADGGPTDLDNLVTLCHFHHRFVHTACWAVEPRPDGRHRYRPPGAIDPVLHQRRRPAASPDAIAAGAPATASADALRPPHHTGDHYDLDVAVATLQRLHEHAHHDRTGTAAAVAA